MHYSVIKDCDIANGPGVRVVLFVSGCTNHCEHCFQPETWDFDYGNEFTEETEKEIFDLLDRKYIRGLTILGGEPMEPKNQGPILSFLMKFRKKYPINESKKDVWMYTGFTYEQLLTSYAYCHTANTENVLKHLDVIVDGRFVEKLKSPALVFRGSSNQRIIDVQKTLKDGVITLMPFKDRSYMK